MRNNALRGLTCLLVALVSFSLARAEESTTPILAFPSFTSSSLDKLQSSGSVSIEGDKLRLTPAENWKQGVALYKSAFKLSSVRSFSSHFSFQMGDPECYTHLGADGLAFIIQSNDSTVHANGYGLGYAGTELSVAIEFDTYFNRQFQEPEEHHIGLSLHGDPTSYSTAISPYTLNDGRTYYAWAEYDGANKMLEVRLSDSTARPAEPVLKSKVDLATVLEDNVFVGFSAATGACREEHDIKSFFFQNGFVKNGITPSAKEESVIQKKNYQDTKKTS